MPTAFDFRRLKNEIETGKEKKKTRKAVVLCVNTNFGN